MYSNGKVCMRSQNKRIVKTNLFLKTFLQETKRDAK